MMIELSPEHFFDLSAYAYESLFNDCKFIWEALNKLTPFFKSAHLGNIEIEIQQGVFLVYPELISIGKGTVVEPGAYIKGPCIIGENCQIRHGAYIRGEVLIGSGCIVGHDTEIKHSILLDNSFAAHFAYVGDSILGNRVNLGAGVKCANLRLDRGYIHVYCGEKKINTGLKKLGAIIGDDAQLGCNSVTNPGTLISKGYCCFPCTNFGGWIPPNHLVKPSSINQIIPL
jgi:UDP-N-acetylglucosamine diphosphorylase / glucose-1-phosphate thymidylyltransferase / UDP-N-acetylgalactosamine diphosphorylase / glucosamine-1-phosphate N-acetyltransferase / galactosamine-1-phosphate N-acetyltransferase